MALVHTSIMPAGNKESYVAWMHEFHSKGHHLHMIAIFGQLLLALSHFETSDNSKLVIPSRPIPCLGPQALHADEEDTLDLLNSGQKC